MTAMDPHLLEAARKRLLQERERLTRLREGISNETSDEKPERIELQELSSIDQHQADVGSELFEREKDIAISQRLETELEDIEDAFGRIDSGTYGTCETCKKPIPKERLEAIPQARFCVDDQARAERATA